LRAGGENHAITDAPARICGSAGACRLDAARRPGAGAAASIDRFPHQDDGQHLTAEGYRMLAETLLPQVTAAMRR
jgi:lysophospholipase L1-like esterase